MQLQNFRTKGEMDLEEQQNLLGGFKYAIALNNGHSSCDRWQVYQRLQELNINCWCESHQPLIIEVEQINEIVMLWSVMRQFTGLRCELIAYLERCWQISAN